MVSELFLKLFFHYIKKKNCTPKDGIYVLGFVCTMHKLHYNKDVKNVGKESLKLKSTSKKFEKKRPGPGEEEVEDEGLPIAAAGVKDEELHLGLRPLEDRVEELGSGALGIA